MINNAEFVEEVWLHGVAPICTQTALKNKHMLRLSAKFNADFIRNTGEVVIADGVDMDIREANIRDMVRWFEKNLRHWVAQ